MGNITEFSSAISKSGVALSSEYEVSFLLSEKVRNYLRNNGVEDQFISDTAHFRATIAELPSRQLQVLEDRSLNGGVARRIPTSMVYTEANMSLMLSEDMRERHFIEQWQNYVIGGDQGQNSIPHWRNRYYEDFATGTNIDIHIKSPSATESNYKSSWFGLRRSADVTSKTLYTIRLHECFPVTIGQINLDWSNDNPIILPITFQYRYWTQLEFNKTQYNDTGKPFTTNLYELKRRAIDAIF